MGACVRLVQLDETFIDQTSDDSTILAQLNILNHFFGTLFASIFCIGADNELFSAILDKFALDLVLG